MIRRGLALVLGACAVGTVGGLGVGQAVTDHAVRSGIDRAEATLAAPSAGTPPRYDRTKFGLPWADVDRNGCDTRNDVLARDLTDVRRAADRCRVLSGVLADPYSGRRIQFARGPRSSAVQIDHVVPLGEAWRSGAWAWTDARRLQYANDPAVLLAVDGPLNEAKGDSDPAQWVPPNTAERCDYGRRWTAIKAKYGLEADRAEVLAVGRLLATCTKADR